MVNLHLSMRINIITKYCVIIIMIFPSFNQHLSTPETTATNLEGYRFAAQIHTG